LPRWPRFVAASPAFHAKTKIKARYQGQKSPNTKKPAGLLGLTRVLALELAGDGITVVSY
jgi:hypothetical protein